ncbi:MAG: hypothetical protein OQJ93_07585 [Ignavibacteriaceae bacterium]|jgi:hypothetical protein|nr:hypothetical protein [Ignavibacteriaceae bacterium]MCW8812942.1 hypothetical protein [Chlorobium sp.]MCW8995425.1 hypothetical protein [Psychromonas sp.]MCW8817014.1 hypothetical protein [Ignavibacteriaceae bacterium]MCW8824745.1 hypothetical protein [Ignavibacteriaceae bacterium]
MDRLKELLSKKPKNIEEIALWMDELVEIASENINNNFSPRRLSKGLRSTEPLPTDTRQLSSFRTRIGTMLEYALSTELDRIIREHNGDGFYFTFAVSHEYPDFYLRDNTLARLLRIEMKAVDADSDEQAARFGVPTVEIENDNDLLLLVGWKWEPLLIEEKEIGEYPHIFVSMVLPAKDIVSERDKRLEIAGGKIEGREVLVPKRGQSDQFVVDPGNYGKFWRLVHGSRRNSKDLAPSVNRFLEFLKIIDEQSPNSRFKNEDDK